MGYTDPPPLPRPCALLQIGCSHTFTGQCVACTAPNAAASRPDMPAIPTACMEGFGLVRDATTSVLACQACNAALTGCAQCNGNPPRQARAAVHAAPTPALPHILRRQHPSMHAVCAPASPDPSPLPPAALPAVHQVPARQGGRHRVLPDFFGFRLHPPLPLSLGCFAPPAPPPSPICNHCQFQLRPCHHMLGTRSHLHTNWFPAILSLQFFPAIPAIPAVRHPLNCTSQNSNAQLLTAIACPAGL